jgi:hypothetical protein
MGANNAAESSNITTFDIYSNYGNKKVPVLGGIAELHFYESILDNTVRVTAIFADTGIRVGEGFGALEKGDIQLTAGEKAELVMEDNFGNKLVFKGDYHLRIKEVRNIIEHTQKTVFTIDFYSKECIDNELSETRVSKRYDGKISDSVYRILKRDCIKTPKNVEVDTGLNNFNFLGHVEKPFHKIPWLAKRCVPEMQSANGSLAGYFFYEVADDGTGKGGYKFKSIDKLFEQEAKRKYIFNNTVALPLEYDAKILDYSFDNTVDLQHQLISGGLVQTELRTFDPYSNKYAGENDSFNAKTQLKENNIGGLEVPKIGSDLDLQNKTTRISTKIKDTGTLPAGKTTEDQLKRSKDLNFNIDDILRQSYMRYNNLFTTKLSIAIAGDYSLHVGDIIYCDFPEISDKNNQVVSYRKSGLYMIVDLCHFIGSNPGQTFTRMNLVRESIGRKPFKV